jgi:hypothetical protein
MCSIISCLERSSGTIVGVVQRTIAAILAMLLALAGVPAPAAAPPAEASACCCGDLCACGPSCDCAGPIDDPAPRRDEVPRAPSVERERTLPPATGSEILIPEGIGRDASWPLPNLDGCPRDARTIRPRICVWLT